jgi:hypothetical protein
MAGRSTCVVPTSRILVLSREDARRPQNRALSEPTRRRTAEMDRQRSLVRCVEDLVFYFDDWWWIEELLTKNGHNYVELMNLKAARGGAGAHVEPAHRRSSGQSCQLAGCRGARGQSRVRRCRTGRARRARRSGARDGRASAIRASIPGQNVRVRAVLSDCGKEVPFILNRPGLLL